MGRLANFIGAITRLGIGKSGIIDWATSPSGLNFNLFPRQRMVIKLISGSTRFENDLGWSDDKPAHDEIIDLAKLLACDDPDASVWLPPSWEFDPDSGRMRAPRPPLIALLIAGRRSGKTSIASIALAHRLMSMSKMKRFPGVKLLKGQTVGAINVAAEEKQSKVLFERTVANLALTGIFKGGPPSSGSIRLGKRVMYESLPTNAGSLRGRTAALCVLDELAHFPGTSGPASSDAVFDALLPSVRTFGKLGQIIITTSPAGKQGKVWDLYEMRGQMEDLLVMQFATWEMHPFIGREMLQPEFAMDPAMASCEYGAQFGEVDSAFLDSTNIYRCVRSDQGRKEIPDPGIPRRLHLDPAFARDSFAFAVGYMRDGNVFIDEVISLEPDAGQPVDPDSMIDVINELMGRYTISEVSFDQYCAPYIRKELRKMGLASRQFDFTSSSKMTIYSNLRVLLSTGKISLPSHEKLTGELTHLRRTIRPGGFSVAAPSSGKITSDDLADSVAAVAFLLSEEASYSGDMLYIPGGF